MLCNNIWLCFVPVPFRKGRQVRQLFGYELWHSVLASHVKVIIRIFNFAQYDEPSGDCMLCYQKSFVTALFYFT